MEKENHELSQAEIDLSIHGQSTDWYLQRLVSMANENGMEFGITLTVAGGMISGTLISGKNYFNLFAESISESWPHENKEEIRNSFASFGDIYKNENNDEMPPPQYIHLKNSKRWSSNGSSPTNGGMLWRGKINAVSGFSLGSLS